MAKLFANIGDPDQTPRSAVSDLGLHSLPITLLGISRLQWVKSKKSLILLLRQAFISNVDPDETAHESRLI